MGWPAVGVFVGGQGRRMGGLAKGLLSYEGRPLVERVLGACRAAAAPELLEHVYLVGDAAPYAAARLPSLVDTPSGVGPIGGLRALLSRARELGVEAVAVAVDLPYLEADLVRRLYVEQPGVGALAPRQAGRWQPLFARYRPDVALPALDAALAQGHTALQSIFRGLEVRAPAGLQEPGAPAVAALALTAREEDELRDWDRPEDMSSAVRTW